MARNTVSVKVEADARDFERGMDRAQTKAVGFGAAVGTLAGNIAYDLGKRALAAVGDFAQGTITAARDLGESVNAVNKVFGDWADTIHQFGEVSAQAVGLSSREFNQLATNVGGALKGAGLDMATVTTETIRLTQRASDVASVFNTDVADALFAVQRGLQGETEPLKRFNVNLSDAEVRAKAVELGLADTTAEVDRHGKAVAALELFYEQTNDAAGDFLQTSEDLANAQRIAAAEYENAQARLGTAAQAPLATLMGTTADFLNSVTALGGFFGEATDAEQRMAQQSLRLNEAIEEVNNTIDAGGDKYAALANGLLHIAQNGDLTWAQFEALAAQVGLTSDQFGTFSEDVIRQAEAMGIEAEVIEEMRQAMLGAEGATGDLAGAQGELGEETETATVEIESQTEALQRQENQLRAMVDPAFAYMLAQSELAAAQQAYNAAVDEFGENSPEAVKAAQDIATANLDLRDSVAAIGTEGVSVAVEALKSLGVPESVIEKFRADRKRIEEIFRNMVLRVGVSAPTLFPTTPAGGGVGWQSTTNTYFQKGGIVTRPTVGMFEGNNPEAVIPLNGRGVEILADALKSALGDVLGSRESQPRLAPPQVHNIYIDGELVERRVHRANRMRERAGG